MTVTNSSQSHETGVTLASARAAVIHSYGGPEQLVVAEIPVPEPTGTQVLVDVAAVSVNPVDLITRAGLTIPEADARFPMVLGWDVAGSVRAVGSSVTSVQVGDRVAAMVFQPVDQSGTYAAQVVLDAALLAPVPDGLTFEQAATVPLVGLTASQLVDQVRVDGARSLLVTGPLGGVGRQAVALAARAGLEVLGAVAVDRAPALLALGASAAVGRDGFAAAVRERYPDGVDAAIDLVGGATSHAAFDLVRDGGRYATAVLPNVDPSGRFETNRGVDLHVHTVQPDRDKLTELLALAAQGVLSTAVEVTYAMAEAAQAHRRQAAGRLQGRIVLVP
jgi:NADPH:quinone reductase